MTLFWAAVIFVRSMYLITPPPILQGIFPSNPFNKGIQQYPTVETVNLFDGRDNDTELLKNCYFSLYTECFEVRQEILGHTTHDRHDIVYFKPLNPL